MIHQLGSALIVACAVLGLTCAVFYGGWFRWWTSDEGRHLFIFMGVVAGVLTLSAALMLGGGAAWNDTPAGPREWARLVSFVAITAILCDRLRVLVKGKRADQRARKENRRGGD